MSVPNVTIYRFIIIESSLIVADGRHRSVTFLATLAVMEKLTPLPPGQVWDMNVQAFILDSRTPLPVLSKLANGSIIPHLVFSSQLVLILSILSCSAESG